MDLIGRVEKGDSCIRIESLLKTLKYIFICDITYTKEK